MTRVTEAIFENGILRPTEPLPLREHQRVRITIDSEEPAPSREEAKRLMIEGFDKMKLRSNGKLPTRDELHERR
jgi:predicted DNA-binding antitoxin AbrB/MazE fold protein